MGPSTAYKLWKVKDILDGLVYVVLPPHRWGATRSLVVKNGVLDECVMYDFRLVNELVPLLQTIAVNDVYANELDEDILDVMQYFEDYL